MMADDRKTASDLAEQGLAEQQAGNLPGADSSLQAALKLDPDATLKVLQRTGADAAPDARDAAADRDAAAPEGYRAPPA